MNIRPAVLSAKKLSNGSLKIRLAVSHNSLTRYIATRFIIPSEKNFRDGRVIGLPDANYINRQLNERINNLLRLSDNITDINYYSCPQLVETLIAKEKKVNINTFTQVKDEWLTLRKNNARKSTILVYENIFNKFEKFTGKDMRLEYIDTLTISNFRNWLVDNCQYSPSSCSQALRIIQVVINYAEKHGYCKYECNPFNGIRIGKVAVRNCFLDISNLRTIRDYQFKDTSKHGKIATRDLFMLSFYLCGMNPVDIDKICFKEDMVCFMRTKLSSRKSTEDKTIFSIQPEARAILDKYVNDKGYIDKRKTKKLRYTVEEYIPVLRKELELPDNFIFYSARKTFAQLANRLLIKDSVIEYCLGDSVHTNGMVIGHYIHVNKEMADAAIRRVLDFVASDSPSPEEWLKTKGIFI